MTAMGCEFNRAAWAERERRMRVQRENIEKMAAETQP